MINNEEAFKGENKQREKQKFQETLKCNKKDSTEIALDQYMRKIVISILKGEISAKQASKDTGYNRETIRRKINKFVFEDDTLLAEYIKYQNKSRRDYSGVNFKGLIVHMMKLNMSQSEMAVKYDIPPRTISRKIEELNKSTEEKDKILYKIAKAYSEKKMNRIEISNEEIKKLSGQLNQLFENEPIIVEDAKSMTELEIEKLTDFLSRVEYYQNQGMTIKQIAKEMNVGISTIRRNRLKLLELKKQVEIKEREGKE